MNLTTCGFYETKPLINRGMKPNNTTQRVADMTIYSSDYFHPYDYMSIRKAVERMGFAHVEPRVSDGTKADADLPMADAILVDAPCSGLGILAKKPDIRYKTLEKARHDELLATQSAILDTAAAHLKEGGRLVYSTCTIDPAENEEQVRAFVGRHPEFRVVTPDVRFPSGMTVGDWGALSVPTRTGMFGNYLGGEYDLAASYVIGDRVTDVLLARNLGARGILLSPAAEGAQMLAKAGVADACALVTDSWAEIADFIRRGERRVEIRRETRETQIAVRLDLDGRGDFNGQISTGLRFLDHMLAQIAHHGGVALAVDAQGDLDIDEHHTMEDVAITLGEAIDRALESKAGIARYGFALPMDDCRALVLLDFGGRIDFEWDAEFRRERVGDVPTEMFRHFFHALCSAARCNLQISARGENDHHKAEAIFKAFARALRMAVARQGFGYDIPSSKGVL